MTGEAFTLALVNDRRDNARSGAEAVTIDAGDLSGRYLGSWISVWAYGRENSGHLIHVEAWQPSDGSTPQVKLVAVGMTGTWPLTIHVDVPVEVPAGVAL